MTRDDQIVCRCEEVTLGEILDAIRCGARDADAVKRMTRAGMGLCQSNTCSRLVSAIIARETGQPIQDIKPVTPRLPVRPIPASVLARTPTPRVKI